MSAAEICGLSGERMLSADLSTEKCRIDVRHAEHGARFRRFLAAPAGTARPPSAFGDGRQVRGIDTSDHSACRTKTRHAGCCRGMPVLMFGMPNTARIQSSDELAVSDAVMRCVSPERVLSRSASSENAGAMFCMPKEGGAAGV